ncbi:MAG: CbiX/SirB N-terminal domain-containing protein, partial [Cyanobium sp.]
PYRPLSLPHPLLLVMHGRAGGVVPLELRQLAEELERRRGAPVALRALTEPDPPPPPRGERPLLLVPLLLLPGGHVRTDVPAIVAALRREGPVRRWPFLGAWPGWQRALAQEVAALGPAGAPPWKPTLLHHPLEGHLAARYLRHLGALCGADCRAACFAAGLDGPAGAPAGSSLLPLALAANRLTEALSPRLGAAAAPLLARPRLRAALLRELETLP